MTRRLDVTELKKEPVFSTLIECHRQLWSDGSAWTDYEQAPRFADGLMLVCSELRAVFTLPDGKSLTARKGDLIYLPEGAQYLVRFFGGGNGIDAYTVNFRLYDASGSRICLADGLTRLTDGAPPECYSPLSRLADACLSPEENTLRKHSELFAFLDAVGERINDRTEEYYPIRRGVRQLLKEWNRSHPIARYAVLSEISETSFYQHFKAWAGISPAEYRTRMRISAAKSLLKNSSLRISEIAAQVGFDDPYYFSRAFKRITGASPRAYRDSDEDADKPATEAAQKPT